MFEHIDRSKLPSHVAVIMDGNGRWAKKKAAARIFGHQNAVKAVRETAEGAAELGIGYLSLFAFSTENWGRPRAEVDGLMALLVNTLQGEIKTLLDNDIRLMSIGDHGALPAKAQRELAETMEKTAHCQGLRLVLALNYSGRADLVQATKAIATKVKQGELQPEQVSPELVQDHLQTVGMPDPELMIRTSGEMRISNFMLWQMAYTELYFSPVLWPDFRKIHLAEAVEAYQKRERRFGKTSEQVAI